MCRRQWQEDTRLLTPGIKWETLATLGTQLVFPTEITQTTLRPDLLMWSTAAKKDLIIKLTVPWEEGTPAAYELKYSELAVEYREGGWTATIHPVEVGFRGFVGKSTILLLCAAGIMGTSLKSIKELAEDSEKTSYWLWLRRSEGVDPK